MRTCWGAWRTLLLVEGLPREAGSSSEACLVAAWGPSSWEPMRRVASVTGSLEGAGALLWSLRASARALPSAGSMPAGRPVESFQPRKFLGLRSGKRVQDICGSWCCTTMRSACSTQAVPHGKSSSNSVYAWELPVAEEICREQGLLEQPRIRARPEAAYPGQAVRPDRQQRHMARQPETAPYGASRLQQVGVAGKPRTWT